jgi:DNA-binding IclR family transcriptional regulator
MKRTEVADLDDASGDSPSANAKALAGTQTLLRGLDIISAVAYNSLGLAELSKEVGLTRSTTYRLATALVDQRFLKFTPRVGYELGPKLLELGHLAARHMSLPRIAHDYLVQLARETGDIAHLGVMDNGRVLYLDKIPGSRRIEINSRIGDTQPLRSTGLGKAMLLDESEATMREVYQREGAKWPGYTVSEPIWMDRMRSYKKSGFAFDLEENEDRIRCVAAPVRDAANRIIGAISVSSPAQYMDDERMNELSKVVLNTVREVSAEFGWKERK